MFTVAVITIALVCLKGGVLAVSERCTKIKTPCVVQLNNDQANDVATCVWAQSYMNCLASALQLAEVDGVCNTLTVLAYRYDAFQEATVYRDYCPTFIMPTSLQQNSCRTEIGTCGLNVIQAFSSGGTEVCSYLSTFVTCMDTQTPTCLDRAYVNNFKLQELQPYQSCGLGTSSLSSNCAGVKTQCTLQQNNDQANGLGDCQVATRYIQCIGAALQNAGQNGVCQELPLLTYRHDALQEATVYNQHCSTPIPQYFNLDSCGIEIANCGRSFLAAFAANNNNNQDNLCSDVRSFKTCMEQNTQSCTSTNTTVVRNMLRNELVYFQYETKCVSILSNECVGNQTCENQTRVDVANGLNECLVESRYATCIADELAQVEDKGTCGAFVLALNKQEALQNAQDAKSSGCTFQIPSYLSSLSSCEREMAECGDIYREIVSVYGANNNSRLLCQPLTSFKSCMEGSTSNCANRFIIDDIVNRAIASHPVCLETTTSTTTTTTTTRPTTSTSTTTTRAPETTTTTTTTTTTATTTTTTQTTTTPTTTPTTTTTVPTTLRNNQNTDKPINSADLAHPLLTTLVFSILMCLLL